MHTCIPSRPRRVNAGNKNTPSMHHPRRQNVTTSMVGLKSGDILKNLTQNGEPQRYSWECRRRRKRRRKGPKSDARFLGPSKDSFRV